MSFNKIKILILTIIFGLIFPSLIIAFAQTKNNYSMPFTTSEVWKTNDFQGVHTSAIGYAIDLFPPQNSTKQVLALGNGTISRVCTANNITVVRLLTDNNDNFRYAYLDSNSVTVKENQELIVKKGDLIGVLGKPGIHKQEKCDLSFNIEVLMLSWEKTKCNIEIQEYKFTCENMKKCNEFADCNYTSMNQDYISNLSTNQNATDCSLLLKGVYKIGDTGDKIIKLQQCLKDAGLYNYSGGITGYFGNYTLGLLQKSNPAIPGTKELNECDKMLADYYLEGENGVRVSQLQDCLKQSNYYNYPSGSTGFFGEYTKSSYNNFLNSYNEICRILKFASYNQGETSNRVRRLQQCLRDANLFDFPVNTGYFGIVTQSSLKVWKSN